MPLATTHDRITLWTAPAIILATGLVTEQADITLATATAYLFSGLMFSGDLDIYSKQYRRWLGLRWIWIPYRRLMRHRSFWSHGLLVGSLIRLLYLGVWLGILLLPVAALGALAGYWLWQPSTWLSDLWQWGQVHQPLLIGIFCGLELGSINHSLSDWTFSSWKRWRKRWQKPRRRSYRVRRS
ncbi:MAG: metal-binding protein [Cyanobacteriota bacterium]|nr:metal-binding protein [Cyanobacteriota bacterium]